MITSLQNEQVKQVVALHKGKGRKEYGQYLIEGKRFVKEAFRRRAKIRKLYYCYNSEESDLANLVRQATIMGIPVQEVTDIVLKKMSATQEPQGILAILEKENVDWESIITGKNTILLVINGIQDPGNLGTILRTALAADVSQIILTKGTVDLYNPKVLRSSMGAIFSQKILNDKEPQEIVNFCKANNYTLAIATMEGNSIFKEETSTNYPLALVIGNEAFGPSAYFLEKAAKKYSLPMFNNVESLNVAMATGIFLYELRRQVHFL
jgi:TrmH family RNA methyltransferase